jgi:AcrR family transcriptional regulator
MSDKEQISTEEKILAAAKTVFHHRGLDGARMQEIADTAGVNKALLHYYYRNKETLFRAVFEDAFTRLLARVNEIFSSSMTIQEKISAFIDYYLGFLSTNSYLPIFILNSLYSRPDEFREFLASRNLSPGLLIGGLRKQIKAETGLDIDPFHIYIDVLALCIFPVLARPLIQNIFGMSQEEMIRFYNDRKNHVPEFILNSIKGYEKEATNKG